MGNVNIADFGEAEERISAEDVEAWRSKISNAGLVFPDGDINDLPRSDVTEVVCGKVTLPSNIRGWHRDTHCADAASAELSNFLQPPGAWVSDVVESRLPLRLAHAAPVVEFHFLGLLSEQARARQSRRVRFFLTADQQRSLAMASRGRRPRSLRRRSSRGLGAKTPGAKSLYPREDLFFEEEEEDDRMTVFASDWDFNTCH